MIKAKIEDLLSQAFKPDFLEVIDESHKHIGHAGAREGGHYKVSISARAFDGKKLLESHRMIYHVLGPLRPFIHALAIDIRRP